MDSGWIITISGGVIVGVIILIIEYGFFQRKEQNQSSDLSLPSESSMSQSWAQAIENAIQTFSNNHPNQGIKVLEMRIKRRILWSRALVAIDVATNARHETFYLEVDKAGDILKISDTRYKVFGLMSD